MRGMIDRDYNHPAVFAWVTFNETWGLTTRRSNGDERYLPETQRKVASVYRSSRSRSIRRGSSRTTRRAAVAATPTTDLNSWHEYLPGWEWEHYARRR